ncbi:hypothetical protein [Spiroplasma ixodetis]|uniref:Adhesin P123 n=1 Tax=Spiroplasma ixodetis TaxID=2141 RepID=A0ABM8BV20_9MOLU|nr:hypothetical protein [Spiroplasma ixodetis]BDT03670.1 hypothetical protein SHM_13160 [Spiroplasma ixodetis]
MTGTDALFNIFASDSPAKLSYNEFVYEGSSIEYFQAGYKLEETTVNKWLKDKTEVPLISKSRTEKAIKFNNFEQLIGWKAKFNVINFERTGIPRPNNLTDGDELTLSIALVKNQETISLKSTIIIRINN